MARFRSRTSRSRSSTSRSWLKSVLRFGRHFPKLLRGDFWRADSAAALWQSLFRRKKKAERRGHARRTGASGWSPLPIGMQPETLEARVLLTGTSYVNDNWIDTSGHSFQTGDTVKNTGTGDDGTITATFNVNAFNTLTAALASGHVSIGDTVVVLSGSYTESPTISIQGLAIEGEYVGDGRLGAGRDTGHAGAFETTVQSSGYQVAANNVTIEGIRFTSSIPAIEVQSGVTSAEIQDNIFIDNSHGVQIDGGGSADLKRNLFTNSQSTFASQIVPSVQGITVQGTGGTTTIEHNTFQYFLDPTAGDGPGGVVVNATGATVSIQANQFSNNSVAINVLGGTANVSGNASGTGLDSGDGIFNNTVGIKFSGGGSVTGNTFQNSTQTATPNGTDLLLASGAGAVTDGGSNAFYASTTYIDDESSGGLDASGDTFNGSAPPSPTSAANLSTLYGLENKITDGLDQPGSGLVRIDSGDAFVSQQSENTNLGAIQRAVNLASSGNTVYVQAGNFAGNVDLDKSVTLLGAESGVDARTRSSVPETVVSDPSVGFSITGPGVRTINGFTVDAASGIDPAIQNVLNVYDNIISGASDVGIGVSGNTHATISGNLITGTGDGIDVSDSAIVAITANSITVGASGIAIYGNSTVNIGDGTALNANQIEGQVIGIALYGGTATIDDNAIDSSGGTGVQLFYTTDSISATIEHNTISGMGGAVAVIGSGASALIDHNLIQNVGSGSDVSPSVAVLLQDDGYASVESNTIQNVDIGIEIDSFDSADAGSFHTITDNTIAYAVDGMVISNISSAASAFDVENNAIASEQVQAVVNDGLDVGLMLLFIGVENGVTLDGNTIDGAETGVFGWNDAALTISGGSITNAHDPSLGLDIGVLLDNFDPLSSQAATNDESFTLSGVQFSNDDTAVEVIDEGHPAIVSAHLTNSTHITGRNYGAYVSGANASAMLDDVTIDDPQVGVAVYGGSASISNSTIEHNTVGVFVANGGQITSLVGNTISLNGTGVEIGSTGTLVSATHNFIDNNTGDGIFVDSTATTVGPITENDLSGNGSEAIDDLSSLTVDASLNWWGVTTEAAVQSEINGLANVDYTPWFNSDDASAAPGFQGDYSMLNVGSGGAQVQLGGRINEAVADVTVVGLINIYPGTYVEQVVIGENLTLHGIDEATTVIQSPASLPVSFTTSADNHPVVFVHNNANVTIDHLTVDGDGQGNGNYRIVGVGYYNASGTIDHVAIEHVRETPLSGDQQGVAILADIDDSVARSLHVTNDTISDYQKNGMVLAGAGLTADVEHNMVAGAGQTPLIAQNGIELGFGAGGTINANTISGDSYTGAGGIDSTGILIDGSASGTSATNNNVTGCDVGIYALDTTGLLPITANTIGGSYGAGIVVQEDPSFVGDADIGQNTIENAVGDGGSAGNTGDGIDLYGDITGTTIHNNFIQNNTGTGIYLDGSPSFHVVDTAGPLHINDNSITGNATAGIDNESTAVTVDATSNWWGTANGPTNPANTYNVGHQGDKIIGPGTTNFVPWLNDGTDTDLVAPGFQPNATTFAPVTDVTPGHFGQFSSIQAAIDASTTMSGDHLQLAAGTFTENVDVTKSLTITGAGQGVTTVYPATSDPTTGGSLGGSTVFLVDASNVAIEDLTVDGNNPNITSGVTVGGVDIDARTGIITNWNHPFSYTGLTVEDVTVQNIYLRGIEYSNGGSGTGTIDIENDTVTNVQGDSSNSIAIFNFAGSGTIAGNTVSYAADAISANHSLGTQFHDNVITHSLSGIHTDNMGDGGGTPDAIYDNNVSLGGAGSYGIFVFVPYLNVSVHDNTISGVDVGLAAFGGQGGTATFANNTVSVNSGGTGAFVTTDTLGFGEMNVSATFNGDSFTGGQTGIFVQQFAGATSTATISGVTIGDPAVGVYVIGGHTNVSGSQIYHNGIGVEVDAGGSATLSNNSFDGGSWAADNTVDLKIDSGAGLVTTSGDTFAGNNYFIDNLSTQNIDATGDVFHNVSPTDTNFRIEDKMYHKVDDNSLGLVTWVADNLYVTTPGSQSGTTTDTDSNIQRGIDAANVGDTVNVEAGTYSEDVNIDKSLTLLGAQSGIDPGATGWGAVPVSEILGIGANAPVDITSGVNDVTISGFDIESPSVGSGALNGGIWMNGSTGITIDDNVIQNNTAGIVIGDDSGSIRNNLIQNNNAPGPGGGNGVEFFTGSAGAWVVAHNHFTSNTSADILLAGGAPISNVTISNNVLTNSGGIDLFEADHVTIFENSSSAMQGPAVYLGGGDSNIEVSQNDLSNNPGQAAVMVDNAFGVGPSTNGITIHNNFFDNNAFGVDVTSGALTGTLAVNDNHIQGNTTAGLENDSTATVNADFNWWGDPSGPRNAANPGGTGDKIVDPTVTFSPWLTGGDDAQDGRADGFQPEAGAAVSISGSSTGTEGGTYTLSLSPSSDITSWDINWGDGTIATPDIQHVAGDPATVTHIFSEGGSYTISAVAHTVSNGDVASNDVPVTVADAALAENSFSPPAATEGAAFSGTVFNFSDADPAGTASDYTAVIVLGDGNTVTLTSTASVDGQIVANGSTFDVNLTHTYLDELSAQTFSVTVTDSGGASVGDSTTHFTVADAALTAGALTPPAATEGASLTDAQLFQFSDADPNAVASDYTATITWGDGTTTTVTSTHTADGQIVGDAAHGFDVRGSHTYLEETSGLTFKVSVTDHSTYSNGFETAASTNDWTEYVSGVDGAGITRTTSGSGLLPSAPASGSYYAVITNTDDGYQTGFGGGGYTFFGGRQRTYTGAFDQSVAIYINTAWAAPTDPGSPAFWLDMTPNHNDPNNYGAEHNFRFWVDGSGTIKVTADGDALGNAFATITSSGWYTFEMVYYKAANPSDPALTDMNVIDATGAGVGSKTGLQATSPGGPLASSDLTGHGYAWLTVWQNGFANDQLAIDNMNTAVLPISATATINVADAALSGTSAATATGGIEGGIAATLSGATFTDANAGAPTSDFSTSIDWGDSTALDTSATVSGSGGNYNVNGSHVYAEEGTYTFTITVTDDGGKTTTITCSTTVGDATLTGSNAATATGGVEGAAVATLTNATFSDANAGGSIADFSGTINWGDSHTTNFTASDVTGSAGSYTVNGSHLYAEEGTYNITVTVNDDGGNVATITGAATVVEGTITFANGSAFGTVEGNGSGTMTVANFSDTGLEPAAAYSAVIHWGDAVDSAGTVTQTSPGNFTVTGDHTYAEESSYNVSVTITDDLVATPSGTTDTANVTEGVLSVTNGTSFTTVEGFATGTQTVANFSDTGLEPASAYGAVIHWSVGQNTVGVVMQTSPGHFAVTGSTTYAEDGSYNIGVTITDDGLSTTVLSDTATVTEGVISFSNGTSFTAVEANDSGTQTVANFSDTALESASGYVATIHWGDANDSAGTVTQTSPGQFAVMGSHTYASQGSYHVSVTIGDDDVTTTSGTTDTATVVDRLTVINTNDSGPGSLRQVIAYANSLSGPSHTITFAIPSGPQTINLLSPLPATTVPAVMVLDSTQNVVVVSPSSSSRDNFGVLTKTGAGTLTIGGANNFGGNLQVTNGSLTLNNSVSPTLGAGISATVGGPGTLELAGSVSDLAGGSNGVNVNNNSSAAGGWLVSGSNQTVGGIDGTGNVVVDAGSDLTANHIVQGALVIGGAPGNSATVTIAASDASGNPLAAAAVSGDSQAASSAESVSSDGGPSAAGNGVSQAQNAPALTASATAFVSEAAAGIPALAVVESSAVAAPSAAESSVAVAPAIVESAVIASVEAGPATNFQPTNIVTLCGFNSDGTVSQNHTPSLAANTSMAVASGADQSSLSDDLHRSVSASGKLDPGAVSAAFDADEWEWLDSDSATPETQPTGVNGAQDSAGIDGYFLADDLVEAIGNQWRS